MKKAFAIVILLFAAGLSQAVLAQEKKSGFGTMAQDRGAPIEAISDEMIVDNETSEAKLKGSVVIIQGGTELSADYVTLTYKNAGSEVDKMFARGNVVLISGEDLATSETANYDLNRGTLIMIGDAFIEQGGNRARAEQVEFEIETGAAVLTGNVRSVIVPVEEE